MVRVRMMRRGTTKRPFYRIVVADARSPRDGRFIEDVGWYDPLPNPAKVRLNLDRYKYWLKIGAKPTETVAQIAKRYEKALSAARR